mgnify:CR=1 FL=1
MFVKKKSMLSNLPKANRIIDENLRYVEIMEQLEQQLNFILFELQKLDIHVNTWYTRIIERRCKEWLIKLMS